ncbi:MAG: AraC family transcriptional regulator [Mycobacterium sp.]|nr:AraC family transcriptional regulator [Mycobacterium sp.]
MNRLDDKIGETPIDLFRIRCWLEMAETMAAPHCHDDLEVVLVDGAESAYYQHLGQLVPLVPGRVTTFWAIYPHNLAQRSSGVVLRRLMIPLSLFLSCNLPEHLVAGLLAGRVLTAPVDLGVIDDKFSQWEIDARSANCETRKAMMLEINGWLQRLASDLVPNTGPGQALQSAGHRRGLAVVTAMCRYIVQHFHEPLRVADVAHAAGIHPQYAMTLFRNTIGCTIAEYLTRCRVAEAQRLLLATEATVSDVAFASGFGSVSQFYDRFTAGCGRTPRQYRQDMHS